MLRNNQKRSEFMFNDSQFFECNHKSLELNFAYVHCLKLTSKAQRFFSQFLQTNLKLNLADSQCFEMIDQKYFESILSDS